MDYFGLTGITSLTLKLRENFMTLIDASKLTTRNIGKIVKKVKISLTKSRVLAYILIEGTLPMCDWILSTGPCHRPAMPGSRYCEQHNPKSGQLRLNQYLLNKKLLGDGPARHAAADEVKSLKTEIALLRALVERRLNMIDTDAELATALPQLKDTFLAVDKLVTSCHSMETKLGELLNKSALLSLAQKMVHVIDTNLQGVPDKDTIVERIGNEIADAIAEQTN